MSLNLNDVSTCRDFKDARKILDENNVKRIDYVLDNNIQSSGFDKTIKEFFSISEKNNICKIKNFFNSNDFITPHFNDTVFSTEKLFEIDENENIVVTMNYIKEFKYASEILEPLVKVLNTNSSNLTLTPCCNGKFSITIHKFNLNNKSLEIINPEQYFKNPLYGLLHYANANKELFNYKTINVDKINKYEMNEYKTGYYSSIFNKLELNDYRYELIYEDSKKGKFSFYSNEEEKTVRLLSIDFDENFELYQLLNGLRIEDLLYFLHQNNSNINISILNDYCYIYINNRNTIILETDTSLLKNILNEIPQEPSLFEKILYYFKSANINFHEKLTVADYYQNRKSILNYIRNNC